MKNNYTHKSHTHLQSSVDEILKVSSILDYSEIDEEEKGFHLDVDLILSTHIHAQRNHTPKHKHVREVHTKPKIPVAVQAHNRRVEQQKIEQQKNISHALTQVSMPARDHLIVHYPYRPQSKSSLLGSFLNSLFRFGF